MTRALIGLRVHGTGPGAWNEDICGYLAGADAHIVRRAAREAGVKHLAAGRHRYIVHDHLPPGESKVSAASRRHSLTAEVHKGRSLGKGLQAPCRTSSFKCSVILQYSGIQAALTCASSWTFKSQKPGMDLCTWLCLSPAPAAVSYLWPIKPRRLRLSTACQAG